MKKLIRHSVRHCILLSESSSQSTYSSLSKDGAGVLEYAYNDFANAEQRNALVGEFYGPQFALFKVTKLINVIYLTILLPGLRRENSWRFVYKRRRQETVRYETLEGMSNAFAGEVRKQEKRYILYHNLFLF